MQRLSGIDASFLYLETPSAHMHVCMTGIYDTSTMPNGYSFEAFRDHIVGRFHSIPAFTRRLVEVPFQLHHPMWVEDPDFDPDYHVRRITAPEPGGRRELAAVAAQIASVPLDRTKPLWVRNQRNSWHGVDFPYHSSLDVAEYYRQYCRTLAAVDESVGRLLDWLEKSGQADNTLVMFMGDNGFLFGEFGLIDKRNAYEPSMRVPLLGQCPGVIPAGSKVRGLVANIDIGPTILEAAGLTTPSHMDGRSFLSLAAGKPDAASNWRKELVYEYYWEYNFPHTPTIFALRTDEYKFIQYHGIWDIDELYDLQSDPGETRNLIFDPTQAERIKDMRQRLGKQLEAEGANQVPFTLKRNMGANLRRSSGSGAAEFPPELQREKNAKE